MSSSESNNYNDSDNKLCVVEFLDLIDEKKDLSKIIEKAYGSNDSIGILAIRNVPGFVEAKSEIFPLVYKLAVEIPELYREEYLTDKSSLYNAGWSYGKEKLGKNKPPDTSKGSYYYNPVTDSPGTEKDREQYPLSYPRNKWPDDNLVPGFKEKAINIGLILKDVVVHVSRHIDQLAHRKCAKDDYPSANYLYNQLKDTDKVKARLLYYYPMHTTNDGNEMTNDKVASNNSIEAEDSWIGWHNDSGFLTALAGDMYVDHATGQKVDYSDGMAGLYVVTRNDETIRIRIPDDCCAVQIGECTQILTNGVVRATPHCVRGGGIQSSTLNSHQLLARISLPCFVDTPPTFPLRSTNRKHVLDASINTAKVPPLESRWTSNDMTFGEFLRTTFSMYYEWDK